MEHHESFMQRCFDLAKLAGKQTATNPKVGAVLVYNNRIIGEGYHQHFGGPHAEVNAISIVPTHLKHKIPEAVLYVSLEPCCIQGKTPACSDLILNSGIKKVFASVSDPNPQIADKSFQILRKNGIEVVTGILEKKGEDLIRPFMVHLNRRPYVILKFAQSSDAYFGKRGKQLWITNRFAQMKVHQWRAECDGILIGYETARVDNPKLTTRLVPGEDPLRIVIDNELSLDKSLHLWSDNNNTLFVSSSVQTVTHSDNKRILSMDPAENQCEELLKKLFQLGIATLIIEGGAKTICKFVNSGLWDEARIIRSDKPLGNGIRAPKIEGRLFRIENLLSDRIEYVYAD